jgi:hypothetical protein
MTKEFANFLQLAAAENGHDCEIREDYSGRGMMGNTTHAVIVDDVGDLMCDVIDYIKQNMTEGDAITTYDGHPLPDTECLRRDNCARQTILY